MCEVECLTNRKRAAWGQGPQQGRVPCRVPNSNRISYEGSEDEGGGVASKTPQGERGHEETEEARSTEA